MKVIYFLLLSLIFNIDGLSGFVVALAIIIIRIVTYCCNSNPLHSLDL